MNTGGGPVMAVSTIVVFENQAPDRFRVKDARRN